MQEQGERSHVVRTCAISTTDDDVRVSLGVPREGLCSGSADSARPADEEGHRDGRKLRTSGSIIFSGFIERWHAAQASGQTIGVIYDWRWGGYVGATIAMEFDEMWVSKVACNYS
jgi:hypothetical protein